MPASKHALFLSSDFFRTLFHEQALAGASCNELELPRFSTATLSVLMDFCHANSVDPELAMDVGQVEELLEAVELLKPSRRDELRNLVQRMLMNCLRSVADSNLTEVVKILLLANRANFAQLKLMCYTSIVNFHYEHFVEQYRIDVSAVGGGRAKFNALSNALYIN